MEPLPLAHEATQRAEPAAGALPSAEPASFAEPRRDRDLAGRLEADGLVFLPETSFRLTPDEQRFLAPTICDSRSKNVSYDPALSWGQESSCSFPTADYSSLH